MAASAESFDNRHSSSTVYGPGANSPNVLLPQGLFYAGDMRAITQIRPKNEVYLLSHGKHRNFNTEGRKSQGVIGRILRRHRTLSPGVIGRILRRHRTHSPSSSDALSAFGEVHLTLTLHKRRVRRLLLLLPRLSLRKLPETTNRSEATLNFPFSIFHFQLKKAKRPLIFHFNFSFSI